MNFSIMSPLVSFLLLIFVTVIHCDQTGIITSENYPEKYPNNFNRNYIINSDDDTVVITFSDFELEYKSDCYWDWLMIIDGDGSTLLPKTCGSDIPSPIRSRTSSAVIVFHSDHSKTFRGFNITWESSKSDSTCDPCSECNGDQSKCEASSSCTYDATNGLCLDPSNGIIKSENYPYNYPNNFNRNYTINAEDAFVITFSDFELEDISDCAYDWVMIIDGDGSTLLPKTCGSDIPSPIRSHTNTAVIVFHSDHRETFRGFKITWESRKSDSTCDPCSNCNGEQSKCEASSGCTYDVSNDICLAPKTGTIKSENYPDNYPNNFNRNYTIDAEDTVTITFSDIELEDNPDCSWDWVMIIDGDGSTLLPKTCGSDIPSPIRSHTNTAVIVFHSDRSETFRGFKITWESSQSDSTCDPCSNCNGELSKCEASSGCTYDVSNEVCIPDTDCKCGLAKRRSRIVGGEVTEVNEYPWQVGLVNAGSSRVRFGGSLVSNRWIMTAAHCTFRVSASRIQALLGEHDYRDTTETTTVRMGISKIENHPDYNPQNYNYDFSLLKMEETISFSDYLHIRPICLPVDATNDYHGFVATVTGWGLTVSRGSNSNKLREVDVKALKNSECKNDYGYSSNSITDQMLCANVEGGGKDSCQNDSGGPLVTAGTGDGVTPGGNYELIGVVSWGTGCALANYPGVYARVTKQLEWIYDTTHQGWSTCPRE